MNGYIIIYVCMYVCEGVCVPVFVCVCVCVNMKIAGLLDKSELTEIDR